MIAPFELFSEPYSAVGNIDARAASKALGRPRLGFWEVFLRETLQNSWDARDGSSINFAVDIFFPTRLNAEALRDIVLPDQPPTEASGEDQDALADVLPELEEWPVLVVTDSGTRGLGGTTRADRVSKERSDFVDFVRNIGRAADKEVGGGTYGFGKGILWKASACATVVVYTKTVVCGQPVSRLIAIGQTDSFNRGGYRFTGRHWWGIPDATTGVEPLTGREADLLAARLGMTRLVNQPTGTSIMVIGPIPTDGAESTEAIASSIAAAALWWAWPHMVDQDINFEITCEGDEISIPDPRAHPVLRPYSEAYQQAVSGAGDEWPWYVRDVRAPQPFGLLGRLAWTHTTDSTLQDAMRVHGSPVEHGNHIALMRRPRFVVKYQAAPPDPGGRSLAGVFVADEAHDEAFARSEPVAHDDWSPENMGYVKGKRNEVRIALNKIREAIESSLVRRADARRGGAAGAGLQVLASRLGGLVGVGVDASVPDSDPARSSAGGRGGGQRASAHVVGRPKLELSTHGLIARFPVHTSVPTGLGRVIFLANPAVRTEGNRSETEPPIGAPVPAVVGWVPRGGPAAPSPCHHPVDPGEADWDVLVSVPRDCAVELTLRRERGE